MILPNLLAITAEASVRTGDHDGAMRLVTDALDIVQSTGERCWEADLHRLRGELLFRQSGGEFAAEQSVQRAVEVARALGVRMLELRAAASLERMHRDRGRQSKGRTALADAYNWFTEVLNARNGLRRKGTPLVLQPSTEAAEIESRECRAEAACAVGRGDMTGGRGGGTCQVDRADYAVMKTLGLDAAASCRECVLRSAHPRDSTPRRAAP
jgi:hypothetical protein